MATDKPNIADVTGTYVLKEQTLTKDGLQILQGKQAIIEIKADGTFIATDFPMWKGMGIAQYTFDKPVSLKGTWRLDTVGGVSGFWGELQSVWGIDFSDDILSANLIGSKPPPYSLVFEYGDPDSETIMLFEKRK